MSRSFGTSIALACFLGLNACVGVTPPIDAEGIGYRQARSMELSAMREWRDCRDEALALDEAARRDANPAQYRASAAMLERCETGLGPGAAGLALEERMRAFALAVQNHLKAGDPARARRSLETFNTGFADRDLYYADGTSFIETMTVLIGVSDGQAPRDLLLVNVGSRLRAEIRRVRQWARN
jgi:hypothetical protein